MAMMRKKIATGLLIGATLSSTLGNTAFAASSNKTLSQLLGRPSLQIEYSYSDIPALGTYYTSSFNKQGIVGKAYRVNYSDYYFVYSKSNNKLYLYNSRTDKFLVGLVKFGNDWVYLKGDRNDPCAQTGWQTINGFKHYFKPRTYLAVRSDFLQQNTTRYYFNEKGQLQTGFIKIGPKRFYANSSGVICSGFYSMPNGDRYYFNPDENDTLTTGWKLYRGSWMHFNKDGVMSRGIVYLDDIRGHEGYYLFTSRRDGNAYQSSGYYTDQSTGKRYLFDGYYGEAHHEGWYDTAPSSYLDSRRVYFTADGSMAQGVTDIKGEKYLYTQSRKRDYNWYQSFGWYSDKKTGLRYYFDVNDGGKAVRNQEKVIDGKKYKFNEQGALTMTYL